MREILFRGKRKDNGEWVYGSLISLTQGEFILTTNHYNTVNIDLHEKLLCNALWEHNDFVEVLPKTICEYTGLTDKNGNKIFEGDIVRTQAYRTKAFSVSAKEKRFIGVVKYFEHKFNEADKRCSNHIFENGYKVEIIDDMQKFRHGGWSDFWDCDVIGNIHDNTELLTEKT